MNYTIIKEISDHDMQVTPTSLLSAFDVSTDSPSQNATVELCPHCSHSGMIKMADALKEAEERASVAEQLLEKQRKAYEKGKKWMERTKEKNNRLFQEREKLEKDNIELKMKLKEMQTEIDNLEVMLSVVKKQAFQSQIIEYQSKLQNMGSNNVQNSMFVVQTHKPQHHRSKTPGQLDSRPENSSIHPKDQYFLLKNRSAFIGEMLNGVPHGRGRLFINFQQYYEGEFRKHKPDGFGIMRNLLTNEYYQGQWSNSKRHGKGIKVHGKIRYEGDFKDDVAEGWGTGIDMTTNKKYVGYWKNNKFQGEFADSIIFYS